MNKVIYVSSNSSLCTVLLAVLAQNIALKLNHRLLNVRTKSLHQIFKASEYLPAETVINSSQLLKCQLFCMQYCAFFKDYFHNSDFIQSLLCINDARLSEATDIIRIISVLMLWWRGVRKLYELCCVPLKSYYLSASPLK